MRTRIEGEGVAGEGEAEVAVGLASGEALEVETVAEAEDTKMVEVLMQLDQVISTQTVKPK